MNDPRQKVKLTGSRSLESRRSFGRMCRRNLHQTRHVKIMLRAFPFLNRANHTDSQIYKQAAGRPEDKFLSYSSGQTGSTSNMGTSDEFDLEHHGSEQCFIP